MPKSILVDPEETFKSGRLAIKSISLNRYKPHFKRELNQYGEETLLSIYHDMLVIREFETMLDSIKKRGEYAGIQYTHDGPAHLSIGQEAAAVGQALTLDALDFIFGSHRSHGEILAKCLSAIRKFGEDDLLSIIEGYLGGETFRIVSEDGHDSTVDLAEDFVLYGTLAEIFGRRTGFNRGLGGSMHAFFAPFGSMPNNAIVGASADIAAGAALFKRINNSPGMVIANIGDSAAGCGPVWEAMMMASMDQYLTLWDRELGGRPPIIFNFFNNFYGMGGQPEGETMGFQVLARMGAGVNPECMHAERINGYNPLAVADAVGRKRKVLKRGEGPVLLETLTYRFSGHSPSDASSYRTREEIELWRQRDCISAFGKYLIENGVTTPNDLEADGAKIREKIRKTLERAVDPQRSPYIQAEEIGGVMFSNLALPKRNDGTPEVRIPLHENPRVQSIMRKTRFGLDDRGVPLSGAGTFTVRDGLFEALLHRFHLDPTLVAFGEENRDWGGAFGVYRGLTESLPYHRLFNTPISEGAVVGCGVGYALCGGRAVVELMYCDFMGRAGDEIFNQLSKWQAMSAGYLQLPLVVRVSVGNKYGAQHSQDWSSMVAHVPGLKVMFPATPYDAKGMLNLALNGTDPVIFFESQRLYDTGEWFVRGGIPEEYFEVPEGQPAIRRHGADLTLITLGATLYRALEAATRLDQQYGISAEVIDLRFLNPLDFEILVRSVQKTSRVVLASDACSRSSFLHDVACHLTQFAFDYLDAPPVVVGARNWITPAPEFDASFFPQSEWIIDTIHERVLPLPNHQVSTRQSLDDLAKRQKKGI